MRCSVKNCPNYESKRSNKSNGITFHKIPKDPVQYSLWIKALTTAGYRQTKQLSVCSDHFLPEEFYYARANQRRVKAGAVPTLMDCANQPELKVCRVCLALDVKMHKMKDFKLSVMFQNVTGISASDKKERALRHVCWECTARLTAAAAFREKALLSNALLNDLVIITHSNIALLKRNHSSLKSSLSVQTVFTATDIECEDTVSESKEKEISLNDETDITETKSELRIIEGGKEIEFEEPWIDAPVKAEVETDPIAETSINFDGFDSDTSREDGEEDEIRNTVEQINEHEKILSEDTNNSSVPMINDADNIVLVDDKKKKKKRDVIVTDVEESSSEEDTPTTTKDVSVNKSKRKTSSKVGAKNTKARFDIVKNRRKQKIIALKKKGLNVREIAKETGLSIPSVDRWWNSYTKIYKRNRKGATTVVEDGHPPEPGKEMRPCSAVVRQRLQDAGLEHILMKKPGKKDQIPKSKYKEFYEDLRERIVALKQEGMNYSQIAYLLDTSTGTVRKWWLRWCNEGHMQPNKPTGRRRKTTPEEDQLFIDRVTQEQTVHTLTLAKEWGLSPKCVRRRLAEAGFKREKRIPYVPLKAGRNHSKADEEFKQRIITMKLNGVAVTDIAKQCRVPRNTIYLWWKRWRQDNNTSEQDKSGVEDTNVEKSLQKPTIISSQKTKWRQKLPDVESKS